MNQPFAAYRGQAIRVERFNAQVSALAEALPDCRYIVNFCEDRYRFCAAFAASLASSRITLLPPDRSPRNLRRIDEQYPGALYLTDDISRQPEGRDCFHVDLDALNLLGFRAPASVPAERTALIAFTSGSTGEPQAHEKTWGSLCESARLIDSALGFTQGKSMVATVPPQHMYGLELSVLLPLRHGAVLDAGKPFFPRDIAEALSLAPEPRILVTTPIHLRALLRDGIELPRLDSIVSATAPLARSLAADCENRFGAPLVEIYGCTEAGSIASRRSVESDEWTLFENIRLVEDGAAHRVEAPHLRTPATLNDIIETLDARRFRLRGRAADLVNIAGKRNSIGALNRVLAEIEGVVDGTFFLPEEDGGGIPRLLAFAVAPTLSAEAILAHLREQLDPAFVPRTVYLLDALPRAETGKLPRMLLEEILRRRSASARATGVGN